MAGRQGAEALREYNRKRDFGRTAEPRGAPARHRRGKAAAGPGYLIQKHAASRLHYDFRLELDGVLKSWAVTRGPSSDPQDKRLAVRTEDHPLDYGDFEGVIPKGEYGGGTVMLWDRGSWEPKGDPHEGLENGKLSFVLHGERLQGGWALVRMRPRGNEKRENWLLIKERDDWAEQAEEPVERFDTSVVSGRAMEQIAGSGKVWHSNRDGGEATPEPGPPPSRKGPVREPPGEEAPARKEPPSKRPPKKTARRRPAARGTQKPAFVAPALATLVDTAPEGDGWLHEIKWDGYRLIAVIDGDRVRLFTRNGKDWSDRFGAVLPALQALPLRSAVIDGEVVALSGEAGGGTPRSDFAALQQAMQSNAPLCFVAFDLLHLDGEDLRKKPLTERKRELQALLGGGAAVADGELRYCDHIAGEGAAVYANACRLELEGVVSKRGDAPYRSGRHRGWLKSKCARREEFVIGGYSPSDKKGRPFASLLLGSFEGGRLVYRGRVGTGFDGRAMDMLAAAMKPLLRRTPAYDGRPAGVPRGARWLEPRLVAEISYTERTSDGLLRHPVYHGLREDKPAAEVHLDRPEPADAATAPSRRQSQDQTKGKGKGKGKGKNMVKGKSTGADPAPAGVRLTSPDKVLFPEQGLTKADLAAYYQAVADWMLPHVANRPASLVRCPEGRARSCFFQRHRMQGMPDAIRVIPIREKDGGKAEYLYLEDAAGLVAMVQIGVLELHVWGAPVADVEHPDRLVFDLDPDAGLPFAEVRRAARDLHDLLAAAGLESFPLLTGGKGVHVVVPLVPERPWPEVKAFARGFAERLAAEQPERFLSKASKQARKGRIFLDWMRNERGATAISPFSTRARAGAPVAVPVTWAELARAESGAAYDVRSLPQRLKRLRKDPWEGYFDVEQRLGDGTMALFTGADDRPHEDLRGKGMSKEKAGPIANAKDSPKQHPSRKGGRSPAYEEWSKDDLYRRAQEIDIDGRSRMNKGELIDALRHH